MSLKRKLSFGATSHVDLWSNGVRMDIDTMDVDWQSDTTISTNFVDHRMHGDGDGKEMPLTSLPLLSWSAASIAELDMMSNHQLMIAPVNESGRTRKRLRNMRPSEEVVSGMSVS